MASDQDASNFDASLGCLLSSAVDRLAAQIASIAGLSRRDGDVIVETARETLHQVLHAKLSRLLVLELNAARVTGRLSAEDSGARWDEFLGISSQREFWDELGEHYPTLAARVDAIVRNRCEAALSFARHWAQDRPALAALGFDDALQSLRVGAGDSHCNGRTVVILTGEGGARLVYKPRSVAVDAVLRVFVERVVDAHCEPSTIRVPRVVEREDHGWAEFVAHAYADDTGLPQFYRGIGHWLALMRLLGGSDLHAENLIAHGASPVIVDCETLFTPNIPPVPSGLGEGPDQAAGLLAKSVLGVGLLPGRGLGLGWRGVDSSALGMLPGQQPVMTKPSILQAGSDEARIGTTLVRAPVSQNHPSATPALAHHWPEVLAGFEAMTGTLRNLDAAGRLQQMLAPFAQCRVRVVCRATEVYAEIGRMLWHPVSLHKESEARERVRSLMRRMAANVAMAPGDPAVIEAEIGDLLEGDVPYFSTIVREGRLHGPRRTHWLPPCDLLASALQAWREIDLQLDRRIIQVSLVGAYLNDGWTPPESSLRPPRNVEGRLRERCRSQAATILQRIIDGAIEGKDGTVTWIAPTLGPTGWSVQPLESDLYNGLSGIAVLAGAYLHEVAAGRADPVAGTEHLMAATLRTLSCSEAKLAVQMTRPGVVRPPQPGNYIGLGSQIWSYLLLEQWGLDRGEGLDRAAVLAGYLPQAVAADGVHDLLGGTAGAIVPLLQLAERRSDARYVEMACAFADRLEERSQHKDGSAFWPGPQWPDGVGGFAHGATGIAWALTRLARVTGEPRYRALAEQARRFEDALFDAELQGWLDLRHNPQEVPLEARTAAAWCHGAVGIALARLDLDPQMRETTTRDHLRMAAAATWRKALGWNHTACHGDTGAWNVLRHAIRAGVGPAGVTEAQVIEQILTSIEQHGACSGFIRDALAPGLLPGIGGIAYQLLRMHPECDLPSILIPGSRL